MKRHRCSLCPRRCGAARGKIRGDGFCRMGTDPVVTRAALHFWEEPCISGERGSGAVFFSGCGLQCAYCQNTPISRDGFGKRISAKELGDIFRRLEEQGAENINLVTPSHFTDAIAEALSCYRPSIPIVYNCGGYESVDALRRLEGKVDIFLPDFKYALSEPAARYSSAPDYPETAKAALLEMRRQQPEQVLDSRGVMRRGLLVRHLILPGNTRNTIAALEWLAASLPDVPVSLMAQYVPCGTAVGDRELGRRITEREYDKVLDRLFALGLDGYVQERSAAKRAYIPPFDLQGVEP